MQVIINTIQDLRQDLETGCPKLTIVIFGPPIFQGRQQYTEVTTINM